MNSIILIFIFLILVLITIAIKNKKYSREDFKTTQFLSSRELFMVLSQDIDGFYKTFKEIDLRARKVSSVKEYIQSNLKDSVSDFSPERKEKILKLIPKVLKKLSKLNHSWFNIEKAYQIQWKFGCIKGTDYELGFPHTRLDIIILNLDTLAGNDEQLEKDLTHEFLHVYQKYYPEDTKMYLKENNFVKIGRRDKNTRECRVNPDTDLYLYKNEKSGVIYRAVFNSENPRNINDVSIPNNSFKFEHPFEQQVYEILDEIRES